jgi:hypothetical protein
MEPGGPERQPYAEVNFIPSVRDYEFGFCNVVLPQLRNVERKRGEYEAPDQNSTFFPV